MVNPRAVDTAAITRAVAVLAAGGIVAVPTETVYGLAADADQPAAVAAIFAAKGRPADHPVIVHVAGADALDAWARDVAPAARELAQAFWPGPLTLVLARSARAHDGITGGQDTVGVRAPAHPWAQALLQAWTAHRGDLAAALAAPSANSFGRISPTTAEHVRADLGAKPAGRVDLILDGGPCPVGIESTIVDVSTATPRLLRPGQITRAALESVLGRSVADADADAPRAPGRLERHYAPRTPLELVAPGQLPARINALRGQKLAVLAPAAALLDAPADVVLRLLAPPAPEAYARSLYALLHRLDAAGAARILVAWPPAEPVWEAVRDRLQRARTA
ncbi:MAG TPA: L-threonylcarbamoyladenylate synthase [Burkholderiaceae bacterium]|nr:L-threonylcarbamoyladenylate synthase [Burkholderiaceae bacterium]